MATTQAEVWPAWAKVLLVGFFVVALIVVLPWIFMGWTSRRDPPMLILRVLFVVFALTQCSSSAPMGSVAPTLATIGGSQTRQPPPTPLVIRGTGQTAIQSFTLPAPISIARFTHDGR